MASVTRSTPISRPPGSGETSRQKRKASHACARCRANQKRCENGVSPSEAQAQNVSPKSCDRCVKSGSVCTWDDIDYRHVFKSRDAITMEAQIERLKHENTLLRARLAEHGINGDISFDSAGPVSEPGEETEADESSGLSGKLVGEVWYGGPSPFKDQEEGDTAETPPPDYPDPSASRSEFEEEPTSYHLCQSLAEVRALEPSTADAWSRYLPGTAHALLSRLEHDQALQNFFSFFSNWQLRVIPDLFLRDFAIAISNPRSSLPRSTQHYSPLTHNAILSVALAYSDNQHLRSREVREKFAKHAKLFLEEECRAATLSTVQGLAVLSSFHSALAEQSLGFMYFGMSVRMAQALGLHVSSDMGNETLSFERDYVFWSMLSQDKCWSFYVGRDQGIRDPHYDVADATINDEMDQSPWIWQYDPQQPAVEQPSYLSHSFVQQVSLMKISEAIMDVVYSMCSSRRGGLNIAKVSDVYLQLRSWEAKLPRYLHIADTSVKITRAPPHVIMVNLAFHWLSILLLRPFFRPGVTPSSGTLASPSTDATSASPQESDGHAKKTLQMLREAAAAQCPSSANQIVRLFERYDVLYGLRFTPITALQIAYTAGLIHLSMYFAATTPSAREKYRLLGVACINILNAMGQTWTSGTVTASIMKRLLENGERRLAAAALKGKTGAQENVRMVRAKKLSSSLAAPPTDPKSDIKTEPSQTSESMDLTTAASTGQDVEGVTPTSKPSNPIPIPIPSTNNAPNFGAMASSPSQIPTFQPMAPGIGIPIDLSAYNHQPTYPPSSLEASVQPWMLPFLTGLGPSPVAFGPSESVSWSGEGTSLTPSSFGSTNDFSVQQLLQQSVSLTPSGWAPNGDGSIGAGIPMPMSIDEFASGTGISGTGDGTDPSGWGLEASGFDPNAWMSPPIPPASVVGADSVVRMDPYPYDGSRSEGYQV